MEGGQVERGKSSKFMNHSNIFYYKYKYALEKPTVSVLKGAEFLLAFTFMTPP
jgi:hypothetical protein